MKKAINFIGARWFFIALSILMISAGVVGYVVNGGFNLSIDFTAGLNQQFRIDPAVRAVQIAEVRQALSPLGRYDLQAVGDPEEQQFVVKVMADSADSDFQARAEARILGLLEQGFGTGSITVQASDFVGPRYSEELATQTIWILLVAVILILIYAAFRFKFVYGMAAVLCLLHDALFMLAVNALFRIEFTTTTVAAVLTIIGYSINDTIVIFDRVRENRGLLRDADLATLLNTSITQTLGRTILTSLTVFLSIIALFVLASGDIKNFALLMLVGIFEGAYSTIFIASPIVYMWTKANDRRRKARELARYGQGLVPAHARPATAAGAEAEAAAGTAAEVPGGEALEAGEAEGEGLQPAAQQFPAAAPAAPASPRGGAQGPPPQGASGPQGPAAGLPGAVPSPEAAGGYIRLQRRHKKRKR
jgi:preprotein translocase subunit SecF